MTYQNIVFDLGNVLVRLNSEGCMSAFQQLGLGAFLQPQAHPEGRQLMHRLGLGLISTQDFCSEVRHLSGLDISDRQIVDAANVMLSDIPDIKKATLLRLRADGHRLFLLSNTIDMHWEYCCQHLFPYKGHTVDDYFEQVFLSQRLHLEKPDHRIFETVAAQTGIKSDDTLFIDDLPENCEAARRAVGWHVFQNRHFDDWLSLC